MEWYRWSTLEEAEACLNYINGCGFFPHVGSSAKTGVAQPTKCKTTKWCDSVTECLDGKFGFQVMSQKFLDHMGIGSDEAKAEFIATFSPTIEEYDPAWFPVDEEIQSLIPVTEPTL